jgi:6-phosphogluconolactonase
MQIQFFNSNQLLIQFFLDYLKVYQKGREALNIALSGGGTPLEIYKAVDENQVLDYQKTKFWQVDERYINSDSSDSNQFQIQKCFKNPSFKDSFNPVCVNLGYPLAVLDYQQKLSILRQKSVINIAILGFGLDGHFASIFTNPSEGSSDLFVATTASEIYPIPERLTMSSEMIESSEEIFVFLVGKSKKPVLQEFLFGQKTVSEFPAKYWLNHPKVRILACLE